MDKDFSLSIGDAFKALSDGEKIEVQDSYTLEILNGCVMFYLGGKKQFSIPTKNFYRIVEPEKCWLELNVEKLGFGSRGQKSVYMELGKELVHEAIKRIEADNPNFLTGHGAIAILKDLIGESK